MDKGQHLRLLISKTVGQTSQKKVVAMSTDLTFHVSAATEDSTTKDSTDTTGMWVENEVTSISYDIQINALIAVGTDADSANLLNDIINDIKDDTIVWDLVTVGGAQNRVQSAVIATGSGKVTNVNPTGTNRQNATFSCTINGYGPYTVGT